MNSNKKMWKILSSKHYKRIRNRWRDWKRKWKWRRI